MALVSSFKPCSIPWCTSSQWPFTVKQRLLRVPLLSLWMLTRSSGRNNRCTLSYCISLWFGSSPRFVHWKNVNRQIIIYWLGICFLPRALQRWWHIPAPLWPREKITLIRAAWACSLLCQTLKRSSLMFNNSWVWCALEFFWLLLWTLLSYASSVISF